MKTRIIIAMAALAGVLSSSAAWAWDQDPFAMYIQRSDKITLGAGDAKDVNAATHVIDPWPRYVGNRRIPGNGDRLSRAVGRYNQGSYRQPAPPIYSPYGSMIGIGGGRSWWWRSWRWAELAVAAEHPLLEAAEEGQEQDNRGCGEGPKASPIFGWPLGFLLLLHSERKPASLPGKYCSDARARRA